MEFKKPQNITIPVMMRGNDHEPIKVGNAVYNAFRKSMTVRFDLPVGPGGDMELFGGSMELGLVEALQLSPVSSEFAGTLIAALDEAAEEESVEVSDL